MKRLRGVLLSIILGLAATIPWIIIGYFGWVASIAGWLIGLAAYKGYTQETGFFDRTGKICVALVIISAIPLSELILTLIEFLKLGYPLAESIILTPIYMVNFIGDYLPSILLGYLMAALGTYKFFKGN